MRNNFKRRTRKKKRNPHRLTFNRGAQYGVEENAHNNINNFEVYEYLPNRRRTATRITERIPRRENSSRISQKLIFRPPDLFPASNRNLGLEDNPITQELEAHNALDSLPNDEKIDLSVWEKKIQGSTDKLYSKTKMKFGDYMILKDSQNVLVQQLKLVTTPATEEATLIYSNTKHSNIIRYRESIVSGNTIHVICEYFSGISLIEICGSSVDWDSQALSYICKNVLQALHYLSSNSILHAGVCAKNIFISTQGYVRLGGFSSATVVENVSYRLIHELEHWMPPEMASEIGYSTTADIWSLGITILEAIDGVVPHMKLSGNALQKAIGKKKYSPRLRNENSWGDTLLDFLKVVLHASPSQRTSAYNLLSHEFILDYLPREYFETFLKEIGAGSN